MTPEIRPLGVDTSGGDQYFHQYSALPVIRMAVEACAGRDRSWNTVSC